MSSLRQAAIGLLLLAALNRAGVTRLSPYLLIGALIWFAVLGAGLLLRRRARAHAA